jgi:hypothetical protein
LAINSHCELIYIMAAAMPSGSPRASADATARRSRLVFEGKPFNSYYAAALKWVSK